MGATARTAHRSCGNGISPARLLDTVCESCVDSAWRALGCAAEQIQLRAAAIRSCCACCAAMRSCCACCAAQPAPGHRSKEKVVELPSELDHGGPDDLSLDVRSLDSTEVHHCHCHVDTPTATQTQFACVHIGLNHLTFVGSCPSSRGSRIQLLATQQPAPVMLYHRQPDPCMRFW